MYSFLQNITIKAANIVEPLGFSGSLPIVFLCCILYMQLYSSSDSKK